MSMRDIVFGGDAAVVRFFHICTDGEHNGIVHTNDRDYQQAIKILAVKAFQYGATVICYCLMSTHMHCIIYCNDYDQAQRFADGFKREYAKYVSLEYHINNIYKDIDCRPREITDFQYLKNCTAYVLMNAVTARIVQGPEEYRWSSFDTYFKKTPPAGITVQTLSYREIKRTFRTKVNLQSSKLMIDEEGNLIPGSFVDHKFIENIYRGEIPFFKSLAYTNCLEEEEKYVHHTVHYDDNELFAEAMNISTRRFGKSELTFLSREEKLNLIDLIRRKTGATIQRIGRILRLNSDDLKGLLGK